MRIANPSTKRMMKFKKRFLAREYVSLYKLKQRLNDIAVKNALALSGAKIEILNLKMEKERLEEFFLSEASDEDEANEKRLDVLESVAGMGSMG